MTDCTASLSLGRSAARTGFVTRLAAMAAARLRHWKNRRELSVLLEMDDSMLKDIGLTRGDVHHALSLPLDENPATALSRVRR
ncbi:MAG: DUF1127 domain-containing protein [Hyphomicrobiaceae bacterium]|nr:DUF1127 domain-containing protein [Hyphomicrobiaceae bacterium]